MINDNERQHFFHIPYSSISSVEHLEIAAMNFLHGSYTGGDHVFPRFKSLSFQCCKPRTALGCSTSETFQRPGEYAAAYGDERRVVGEVLPEDSDEDSDSEFDMSELQYHGSCITEGEYT